ncbi:MAG: FG-GAP-like repeat-containing protein [Pseudomonadota bacterium]|nr:FG-GAP-like repeat-containing protein [Pseudomonadota bacterium]
MSLPAPFVRRVLAALLLVGCAPEPDMDQLEATQAAPDATPEAAAAEPLPDGASDDWFTTVQARIAAEGRAIHARDGAFAADLPSVGLSARLEVDGVTIASDEGDALSLRTTAWGREGALVPVDAREPSLGACTTALDAQGACIRRLEYADPELTEWWVGLGTGLEQGWTVDVAPRGEGLVVVEVAVDGALSIEGGGEDATITDGHGRAWSVGRIDAWDAEGEPLPARVEVGDEGIRIEVDDAGAAYPIEIDPVYTTAAWTTEAPEATASFAYSVSGAGDVNNDGYDDVIVGGHEYSSSTGRAYVYHGSSSGVSTTATTTLTGGATYNFFGGSVSGAGDVNNDGYADVIVGAYGYSSSTGRAYVYPGSSSGVSTTATTTLTGGATTNCFGDSVSGAGDVNNDGYADVIVGASAYSSRTGRAYVFNGYATDEDGDGVFPPEDCDDTDATIGAASLRYVDADADEYGSASSATVCPDVAGYSSVATDCDDGDAAISPVATEVCDEVNADEDCDSLADNADPSATGGTTFYVDSDADGYGGDTTGLYCDAPAGYVADTTDCDDTAFAINPAATEVCDASNTDEDCDSLADNADPSATGETTF